MKPATKLDDKWIKASILGTIWASSEIVLGSFLHNLRVPFSGNILTAIGLIILITASYKWREKGLFWRAGVICALLKTLSPSAVIFGPMVAIFSEAFLLEISVRFMGRTVPAFIIGSILAMSWNLFQKIFNLILYYGYNIVEIYTNLMRYAEKQLQLKFDAVWSPLLTLLIIYALFGAFSALIGIQSGRKITKDSPIKQIPVFSPAAADPKKNRTSEFRHSFFWLLSDILLMIGSLLLIGKINFFIWASCAVSISIIWAIRYKRALRQLVRPKLWVFFVVTTMISAFVFTRLQPDVKTMTDAMLIGVEMNLRAIVLIMGFTVLGTELYNPKIREFFARSYFKQLPPALELSLESLPAMIANTPDVKTILKNPVVFVGRLMLYADFRLAEIRKKMQKVYVLSGKVGSGKTSFIIKFVQKCKAENVSVSGIYSIRVLEGGALAGYDLVNIETGIQEKFLRFEGDENQEKIGRFYIFPEGLKSGMEALKSNTSQIIVIDEVGKLELGEKGWYISLEHLLANTKSLLLLSVRNELIPQVLDKFCLSPDIICKLPENNGDDLMLKIFDELKSRRNRI